MYRPRSFPYALRNGNGGPLAYVVGTYALRNGNGGPLAYVVGTLTGACQTDHRCPWGGGPSVARLASGGSGWVVTVR
jgi:hypothetical protein